MYILILFHCCVELEHLLHHWYAELPFNAMVCPLNWATLKSKSKNCWVASLKLGYFSSVYPQQLFSSNLPISCQFREFMNLFNVEEHFFLQFPGLRTIAALTLANRWRCYKTCSGWMAQKLCKTRARYLCARFTHLATIPMHSRMIYM